VTGFLTNPITRGKIAAALPTPNGTPACTDDAPESRSQGLRFGVLLDAENSPARIADFQTKIRHQMVAIDAALAMREADAVACAAHSLASQVLSIHHHPFADQLRALEHCVRRHDWDQARELQAANRESAAELEHALVRLAATAMKIERGS
jgi:hypothetical protein